MSRIVLGSAKWRDIEEWVKVCARYEVKYVLATKESKIGFEETWYQLVVDVPEELTKKFFLNDIHESWKPKRLQHNCIGGNNSYAGAY